MIRTLLAAVAICAVAGPALAETQQEMVEELLRTVHPECLKPVAALNLLQQQECETAIKFSTGMVNTITKLREQHDAADAARERARVNSATRRAIEVCGPDRWVKDHWEPSCH